MSRRGAFTLAALALVLAAGVVFGPLLQKTSRKVRIEYMSGQTTQALERRNESAFGRILGEVRATASDFMFVKANAYMHVGVRYVKGMRTDALDQEAELAECGPGIPTAIRTSAEDFRGFLGQLERDVKPYRDPQLAHIHTTQSEILPWYRVMTLANPHFVRGYRSGAHALTQQGQYEEARAFLQEGIERNDDNPELFLLYQSFAFVYLQGRLRDGLPWSEDWLDRALSAARRAYELGKPQRPPGGPARGDDAETRRPAKPGAIRWTVDHEEDFSMSAGLLLRLLLLRYEEKGNPAVLRQALQYGREMHDLMPTIGPIRRSLDEIESLVEKTGDSKV